MVSFFWSEEEINVKMDCIMIDVIVYVWDKVVEKECMLCIVVYIVVCECILMVCKDCGIYLG